MLIKIPLFQGKNRSSKSKYQINLFQKDQLNILKKTQILLRYQNNKVDIQKINNNQALRLSNSVQYDHYQGKTSRSNIDRNQQKSNSLQHTIQKNNQYFKRKSRIKQTNKYYNYNFGTNKNQQKQLDSCSLEKIQKKYKNQIQKNVLKTISHKKQTHSSISDYNNSQLNQKNSSQIQSQQQINQIYHTINPTLPKITIPHYRLSKIEYKKQKDGIDKIRKLNKKQQQKDTNTFLINSIECKQWILK